MIKKFVNLHHQFFSSLEESVSSWLTAAMARLVFAGVLLMYFLNSASTKTGEGLLGGLSVKDNAYFQIVPSVVERFNYDASTVPFLPYGLIVYLGTYAEFILPVLVVLGLFTRIAAAGMIVFVMVQSYVDIAFHNVDEGTIGAWFDNISGAAIVDQRALWVFLLAYLVLHGAGKLSLDHLLRRIGDRPQFETR